MNFFLIVKKGKFPLVEVEKITCTKVTELHFDNYTCFLNSEEKYFKDRLVIQRGSLTILINGIVLNKSDLMTTDETWKRTILRLYQHSGTKFIESLNGSFNGFVYDSQGKTFEVFNDHIGSKPIFYYNIEPLISTQISLLYDLLSNFYDAPTLSIESAYCLLL